MHRQPNLPLKVCFAVFTSLIGANTLETAASDSPTKNQSSTKPMKRLPLPENFLQTTSLEDVKRIARERNYDITRFVLRSPVSKSSQIAVVSDVIEELCSAPQIDEVRVGLKLVMEAKRSLESPASKVASCHSEQQTREILLSLLNDIKYADFNELLIQESVARGADYQNAESVVQFWTHQKKKNTPLSWLPLKRLDVEKRLRAWQSLAAIIGSESNSSVDDIEKKLRGCEWYGFSTKSSKWFNNIAWDLGLVCVRPNRQEIVVIAATDED